MSGCAIRETGSRQEDGTPVVAYAYDGTLEGLMTAVFTAYATHCVPRDIRRRGYVQMRLDQEIVNVETNMDLALRVRRGICRQLGWRVWRAVAEASAADDPDTGTIVYRFIRYALASPYAKKCAGCALKPTCTSPCGTPKGSRVLEEWANPHVGPLLALQRYVSGEAERMRQFMRFEHTADDFWFARCNPNAAVVPLVMNYFSARFNTQRFVIYDENHNMAGISENGRWRLVGTDSVNVPEQAEDEASMQQAWKKFYRALSVECRYNPELRRHFMPERLWRNITEVQEQ